MDKLQELTEKLYNEGLSKGKQEGEAILAKANADAQEIIAAARKEADAILDKASKEAESYRVKVEGDVKMASVQAIQTARAAVENLIVASVAGKEVEKVLSDQQFIKEVITAVAKSFSVQEQKDLALVLPEKLQKDLEPFVKAELKNTVGTGVEAHFSKKIAAGFKIGPADGSYLISLTDESFRELISEYLRPQTRKILFGE